MRVVYYLEHVSQSRRLKPYKTLAGARIAQGNRHRHLGFTDKIKRYTDDLGRECVLYKHNNEELQGTWCIIEDTIDSQYEALIEP